MEATRFASGADISAAQTALMPAARLLAMACAYALVITLAVAGFSGFFGPAPAAVAKGPAISGSGATYYFAAAWNSNVSAASVTYGRASDQLLVGDWNGDGLDSLAIDRDDVIRGRNALGPGPEDVTLTIGRPGDTIIVGDWNSDGRAPCSGHAAADAEHG